MAEGTQRVAWVWDGDRLERNAVSLRVVPVAEAQVRQFLDRTRKFVQARRANDPRKVLYHSLEMSFITVDRQFVRRLERLYYSCPAPFSVKIYQHDMPDVDADGSLDKAVDLIPSGYPLAGSYTNWFFPFRGLSTETGEAPKVYVNGTLQTEGSDYSLSAADGKITFASAKASTDDVQGFYVWKPSVVITRLESNPLNGRAHYNPRFSPAVTLEEL